MIFFNTIDLVIVEMELTMKSPLKIFFILSTVENGK